MWDKPQKISKKLLLKLSSWFFQSCLKISQLNIDIGGVIDNGLQAGAPEGACHDNVKSLGKKYHSTVKLSFTNI